MSVPRLSRVLVAAVLALGWMAGACDAFRFAPSCRLGDEHLVHLTGAKEIDAIVVVQLAGAAAALWSEPSGSFGRTLSVQGKPSAGAVRLGPRCNGGMAAIRGATAATIELACSTRPHGAEPGQLRVLRLDRSLRAQLARELAAVGAQSEGASLAHAAGRLEVVWQDGAAESQRVWWAALDGNDALVEGPIALSDAAHIATAPRIVARGARTTVTWSERFMDDEALRSTVVRWDARGGPRTLVEPAHVAAMPQLVALGDKLLLAVRDRPRDAKIGLYLAPVGDQPVRSSDLVRVGRADGVGRPALEPCMGGLVSATPRTYGGDYFIGFNWLDADLHRARGEQQFYEDSHAFTQVSAACLGAHALLLIAEFPQLHTKTAALRALPYRCE